MSIPAAIDEAAREVGSRRLWFLRRPIQTFTLDAPARWWDLEIGNVLPFSHFSVPKPRDEGAQVERWKREWLLVTKITEHWDDFTATIRGVVLRDYLCTLWDPMISEEPPNLAQGIPRLDQSSALNGQARFFTRGSKAWVENAAAAIASRQIVELANNEEEFSTDGEVIQSASTNYVTRPAFVSGLTGWTTIAGTPATDTTDLLFASSITAQSIRLTGVATDHISHTTATIAEQVVRLSLYKRGDAGSSGLIWNLRRSSDSQYFRDSDSTWQVAAPDNTFVSLLNQTPERDYSKLIDLGGTGLTCDIFLRAPGVASDVLHLYHVQLEGQRWATGPIVSDGSTYTRTAELLKTLNNHGSYTWPTPPWTVFLDFMPFWSTADLSAGDLRRILVALFDASNFYSLDYDQATASFRLRYSTPAGAVNATFAQSVTARTRYRLAARCVGPEGEEDLTPYTVSVFVNGVKGTDAAGSRAPILASESFVYLGSNSAGAQVANGALSQLKIVPFALSDAEIADQTA